MSTTKKISSSDDTTKKQQPQQQQPQQQSDRIPQLLQIWLSMKRIMEPYSTQHILGFDITVTILSSIILFSIGVVAKYIMIYYFHWPDDHMTTITSSCSIASIFHSCNLVSVLYILLRQAYKKGCYNPSSSMMSDETQLGTDWKDGVIMMLQFCTGYMIFDGLYTIIYVKTTMQPGGLNSEDYMFLAHHIITTLYMSSTRYYGAGHQSAMICMFLGELTNPLHNIYFFGQSAMRDHHLCITTSCQFFLEANEFLFGILYFLIRAIIGPMICLHATYNLISIGIMKEQYIPNAVIISWIILIWAVEYGSIGWMNMAYGFVTKRIPLLLYLYNPNTNHTNHEL